MGQEPPPSAEDPAVAEPHDPAPMSPLTVIVYAITLPIGALALVFAPLGRIDWLPGWIFLGALFLTFAVTAAVLARVNPTIFRARARFQAGTRSWDLVLLAIMLPAMVAEIPLATFDAGRWHGSSTPLWVQVLGYALTIGGFAGTAWAQAVNPFFEPGVRLQTERGQHVIDTGPYRYVRHPGYSFALMIFFGIALALGSLWALIPAAVASALLILRTALEDRLLQQGLAGYPAYAARVRQRLIPGLW
jgi:protein-S-isoprenylcysteine O-methyltransferase Ste14